jgi:hypothetical protein
MLNREAIFVIEYHGTRLFFFKNGTFRASNWDDGKVAYWRISESALHYRHEDSRWETWIDKHDRSVEEGLKAALFEQAVLADEASSQE